MKPLHVRMAAALATLCMFHSNLSAEPANASVEDQARVRELRIQILFNKALLRPQKETYRYNEPFDLINLVPGLRELNEMIPRRFSLAEHEFVLNTQNITIRHEWMDVHSRRAEKTSVITLSYSGPNPGPGPFYGSRLDVPLFYSSRLGFSDWSRYPMGNYTFTFDRNSPFNQERAVYIRALTRF